MGVGLGWTGAGYCSWCSERGEAGGRGHELCPTAHKGFVTRMTLKPRVTVLDRAATR